jgi:hypothetical protein
MCLYMGAAAPEVSCLALKQRPPCRADLQAAAVIMGSERCFWCVRQSSSDSPATGLAHACGASMLTA